MTRKKKKHDLEEMLWEIGKHVPDDVERPFSNDELHAYRAGRLAPQDAERLERTLADNPLARRIAIAEACGEPVAPVSGQRKPRNRRRRLIPVLVGATAIAATLVILLIVLPNAPSAPLVNHLVTVEGAALRRSPRQDQELVIAYPETTIRVTAQAIGAAPASHRYALYVDTRNRGETITRLNVVPEVGQGVVVWKLDTGMFDDNKPGSYMLVVVIADGADLPSTLQKTTATEKSSRRKWYRREIQVRSHPAESEGDNP